MKLERNIAAAGAVVGLARLDQVGRHPPDTRQRRVHDTRAAQCLQTPHVAHHDFFRLGLAAAPGSQLRRCSRRT